MAPADEGLPYRILYLLYPLVHRPPNVSLDEMPWCADVLIDVHSTYIRQFMEQGLFWTTKNIVGPAQGQRWSWRDLAPGLRPQKLEFKSEDVQMWRLRDFTPEDDDNEETRFSRWSGYILLQAHSNKQLAQVLAGNFSLCQLTRHHIRSAQVLSPYGMEYVYFDARHPENNYNRVPVSITAKDPSWWLWPMDCICPGEHRTTPPASYNHHHRRAEMLPLLPPGNNSAHPTEEIATGGHVEKTAGAAADLVGEEADQSPGWSSSLLAARDLVQPLAWRITLLLYAAIICMAFLSLFIVAATVVFFGGNRPTDRKRGGYVCVCVKDFTQDKLHLSSDGKFLFGFYCSLSFALSPLGKSSFCPQLYDIDLGPIPAECN